MAGLLDYLSGNGSLQSRIDNFTTNEVPQLYDQAKNATTKQEIDKFYQDYIGKALRAGFTSEAAVRLGEQFARPLLQNLQAGEIDKIRSDYGPQTTPITPMVAPEGQGQPLSPNTAFTPQTTPAKPIDQEGAFRIAQALTGTGSPVNPQGLSDLLKTPSVINSNTADEDMRRRSAEKTQKEIDRLNAENQAVNQLPDTSIGDTGISPRTLGLVGQGSGLSTYVTNSLPQRPLSDQVAALKQQQAEGALNNASQRIGIEQERLKLAQDKQNQGGDKPLTDQQLISAFQKAQSQVNAGSQHQGILQNWGITGNPSLAETQATYDDLKRQMQQRGLLAGGQPGGTPAPTQPTGRPGPQRPRGGKQLDAQTAAAYLQKAGGDKNKARQMATQDGYSF